jgi:hypothetical protein
MDPNNKAVGLIILWILIYVAAWKLYEQLYIPKYGDYFGQKLVDVPMGVKCAFNEPQCEKGDLDGWTLVHAVGFFLLGYFIPEQYLAVIILSIIIVVIEPYFGYHPKYIIDPLVNLTAYSVGSLLSPKKVYDYNVYVKDDEGKDRIMYK